MNALFAAFAMLTLIPAKKLNPTSEELKLSVLFYPLVGALFGGAFILIDHLSLATDLKALVLLLVWVLLSGAFHLDGLGDCLDGFFGGKDPEDRHRIMKAPDLGTYGLVGITLTLIFKAILIRHLLDQASITYWLLAIPVAARWAVCVACFISKPPAGNQGLGSMVMGIPLPIFLAATVLAAAGCFALGKNILYVGLIAGIIPIFVSRISQEYIGGLTGDGLGATVELTETVLLFFACMNTHWIVL